MQSFPGTVLLITHDRALLDAVGTRTISVEDRSLRSYLGGWAEFVRLREERAADEKAVKQAKPRREKIASPPARVAPAPRSGRGPTKDISKNQRRRAERLESEIERAEGELAALEIELADPSAWHDPRASAKSTGRHETAKRRVEELYAQLEAAGV